MDSLDKNRLLLEMDRSMKELNREIINPEIPTLHMQDLQPVMKLVAVARKNYLKRLFELASDGQSGQPSDLQIEHLAGLRKAYEELLAGAQAMETAIERGYLDILR